MALLAAPQLHAQSDTVKQQYTIIDTTEHQTLPDLWVIKKPELKTKRAKRKYWRLVRDVKKTLPYANDISRMILEADDTLKTMDSDRERRKFLKQKEKELLADYDKPMRSLTLNQGKLLIKLVDRECSQTSYELVKMYRGGLTAFFWQSFARIMGADLKDQFDARGDDFLIEYVIIMVKNGQI